MLTAAAEMKDSGFVVTVGQDRTLVVYDLERTSLLCSLPTFAAWVYCLAANPVDPRVVAVGSGDGLIRVWRTGTPNVSLDCSVAWRQKAKVMALAWHPTQEGALAFGTDEGRIVHISDALGRGRTQQHRLLPFKHRGPVYALCWGPNLLGDREDKVARLFTVADGKAMMHSLRESERSLDVEDLLSAANKYSQPSLHVTNVEME